MRRLGTTSSGASSDASHERGAAKTITRDAGRSTGVRSVAWVLSLRGHAANARADLARGASGKRSPYPGGLTQCAKKTAMTVGD